MEPITFWYDPKPATGPFGDEAGVTPGYLYLWSGEAGPASCIPVAVLVDDEGNGSIVPTGDAQPVTVVDDR